ncbi:hypothetical protein FFLO_05228 [Filobasidium floriforme]|uniref:Uncharacterized protein n=2 Tax=Filobasidium floriforme TaxID=5210 RepID=A0A8K0JIN3_9TREE|nr:hypothetical protein FFLO_05228 [Filobasidium floriforme]
MSISLNTLNLLDASSICSPPPVSFPVPLVDGITQSKGTSTEDDSLWFHSRDTSHSEDVTGTGNSLLEQISAQIVSSQQGWECTCGSGRKFASGATGCAPGGRPDGSWGGPESDHSEAMRQAIRKRNGVLLISGVLGFLGQLYSEIDCLCRWYRWKIAFLAEVERRSLGKDTRIHAENLFAECGCEFVLVEDKPTSSDRRYDVLTKIGTKSLDYGWDRSICVPRDRKGTPISMQANVGTTNPSHTKSSHSAKAHAHELRSHRCPNNVDLLYQRSLFSSHVTSASCSIQTMEPLETVASLSPSHSIDTVSLWPTQSTAGSCPTHVIISMMPPHDRSSRKESKVEWNPLPGNCLGLTAIVGLVAECLMLKRRIDRLIGQSRRTNHDLLRLKHCQAALSTLMPRLWQQVWTSIQENETEVVRSQDVIDALAKEDICAKQFSVDEAPPGVEVLQRTQLYKLSADHPQAGDGSLCWFVTVPTSTTSEAGIKGVVMPQINEIDT